jgi:hypothetical protein
MLVFAPINFAVGVVLAIAIYVAFAIFLVATAPVIRVTKEELVAGHARIPLGLTGEPAAYRGEEATQQRGRLLDARAWLLIRGWIKPVVKVPLADLDDPTPYWLLSTRNPDQLVRVLEEARLSSSGAA